MGELRAEAPLDLRRALQALTEGLPRPRVHLTIPELLVLEDADAAHALLRCVQEALTNAVRHAGATNVWIALEQDAQTVTVRVRDDGLRPHGGAELKPGHGLTGLRERLTALGGRLEISAGPGQGVMLTATVPSRRSAA